MHFIRYFMTNWDLFCCELLSNRNIVLYIYRSRRAEENLLHSTFTQCHDVYYTVKLARNFVFDCLIVSLHIVFLYDTPVKLTLDHAQWSCIKRPTCFKWPVLQVPRVAVIYRFDCISSLGYLCLFRCFHCSILVERFKINSLREL